MSVLFAADRVHVSVPMLGHAAKIWRSIAAAAPAEFVAAAAACG